MRTAEIKFTITLDENNLPAAIDWEASDAQQKSACKAILLSMWDEQQKETLRIDLWTKDMLVDDMKKFFHQHLMSMADTLERATNENELAADLRGFSEYFAEKTGLMNPQSPSDSR